MLALGRALMSRPKFLILDEPSLGLAPIVCKEIFQVIERLHEEGMPILLIEQNVYSALRISQRGYVLENGRIVMEGTAEMLLENKEVSRAYLGR
jgi:branched-chain amino acid transport system ATP-binding protein